MQKKLLPVFLLLLSSPAIAQPTITSANNIVSGDAFTYYVCDSVGPGASGANVTWNFSTLNTTSNSFYILQSCPGAPDCSTFPGSNLAMITTNSGAYYIADANRFAWNGEKAGGVNFVYSDARDVRRYPFTMGSTYTDTHLSQFTSGVAFTRKGSVASNVDGYGTLQLPTGTYNNVVRVHYTDNYRDSSHVLSTLINDYQRDVYEWHMQGHHEYLLHVEIMTTYAGMLSPVTFSIGTVVYTANTTGIEDMKLAAENVNIYPVPAHGELTIELPTNVKSGSISLMDIVGKTMTTVNYAKGIQQYKINTLNIPVGVYMVRIETDKGTVTRKVEIL